MLCWFIFYPLTYNYIIGQQGTIYFNTFFYLQLYTYQLYLNIYLSLCNIYMSSYLPICLCIYLYIYSPLQDVWVEMKHYCLFLHLPNCILCNSKTFQILLHIKNNNFFPKTINTPQLLLCMCFLNTWFHEYFSYASCITNWIIFIFFCNKIFHMN